MSGPLWARPADSLVRRVQHQLVRLGRPYYFMGTNYWYGAVACLTVQGRQRVARELDFLKAQGVSNVRVLAAAEGTGPINGMLRVTPAYQPQQGNFDEAVLTGLDHLMLMLRQRGMTAVLYLSNNWDWSGGFLQYLNWNGLLPDADLHRKLSWDENRDVVSQFYTCEPCMAAYDRQAQRIVSRTNTLTGQPYHQDASLMAWELANEPRPMRPAAIPAYVQWIQRASGLIKKYDPNHLVTTGSEGEAGSETIEVFAQVQQLPHIDYATIHIWPKNWGWFTDTAIGQAMNAVLANTQQYIEQHMAVATRLQQPLVVEEFGLPRDGHSFSPMAATSLRNQYFAAVFAQLQRSANEGGVLAGCNFWGFAGSGRATHGHIFWQPGDALLADPPQEEQGLNSVFDTDASTWQVIRSFSHQLPTNLPQ
ncbi:MAG: cellulase family glycosylhydrolase [Chitinophagaceae bacterium]|nr:cellulase family glycosylhydrolase [Chitinophagaceae bacterium]